ncbi:DNA repair protein RecN [Psychromonas antarctica]|uniref:DNA repair protein RecN n=1 Tax=Psychromonas antarctica TaxID=67573 RepID=UPI001EE8CD5C|nr:DNA repair protein RecN [Psychromonas antarctica]MCG6201557.1 DNA repair protein RecN [Psychromonas antarctica]
MLTQLTVQHFAIVQFLELEFHQGMTTITGETGAGKSIAIDALGLCIGSRADANMVRVGTEKAEVSARFNLSDTPHAQQWLKSNDLEDNLSDHNECLLRRIITKEGRSRAYINGTPVPLSQLKSLGQLLVNIHGQHAHQSLLKNDIQLSIIDEYANHHALLQKVKDTYQGWFFLNKQLKQQQLYQQEKQARKQLLEYQIVELDEFALSEDEFENIEQEHKRLANSGALQEACNLSLNHLIDGDELDSLSLLRKSVSLLETQMGNDADLQAIVANLQEAVIQIEEASYELRHFNENLELDPEQFQQLENRMSDALALARKHHIQPEFLYSHHQKLGKEYKQLNNSEIQIEQLAHDLQQAEKDYFNHASKLSQSRLRYSKELSKKITESIQQLNMQAGKFHVSLIQNDRKQLSPLGIDNIEFQVATNAGQSLQELGKVASGGELSRIGLAIQVIISQRVSTPTLIFDEVDVGISGATAAVVGKLLRSLGENTQILCVTHLPQVAGNGHQQMYVDKHNNGKTTNTTMVTLNNQDRINELARLLGGNSITERTLANAQELLVQ